MKFYSKRTDKEYEMETYETNNGTGTSFVVLHSALERLYYNLENRPKKDIEPFDVSKFPGIAPMYAVKVTLSTDTESIQEVGELICRDWSVSNEITQSNPIATCINRGFDKAFIRYMQFSANEKSIYSSEEISLSKTIPVQNAEEVSQDIYNPENDSLSDLYQAEGTDVSKQTFDQDMSTVYDPENIPLPDLSQSKETDVSKQTITQDKPAVYNPKNIPGPNICEQDPYQVMPQIPDQDLASIPETLQQSFPEIPQEIPPQVIPQMTSQQIPVPTLPQTEIPSISVPEPDTKIEDTEKNGIPWMKAPTSNPLIPNIPTTPVNNFAIKKAINLIQVDYNIAKQCIELKTDIGIIEYYQGKGFAGRYDEYNLNKLYEDASERVGTPLDEYQGIWGSLGE